MASSSWSLFGTSDALPARIEPVKGQDVNLAIFVDGAITRIYNEASARYKDQRTIKEACKKLLDRLRSDQPDSRFTLTIPLSEAETTAILEPLRLACAVDLPRLQEPALGCLHKLGESTHAGSLTDGSTVSTVTAIVAKCGERGGDTVQLAVVRALLTFVTADHFVLHGESLMQAVRTVFNVAINSDSELIKRTAINALLQMLNTVLKRVTQGINYLPTQLRSASWQSLQSSHSEQRMITSPSVPPPFRASTLGDPGAPRPCTPPPLEAPTLHVDTNGASGPDAEALQVHTDAHAVAEASTPHAVGKGHADGVLRVGEGEGDGEGQGEGEKGVPQAPQPRPPVPAEHSFAYLLNGQHGEPGQQGNGAAAEEGPPPQGAPLDSVTLQPTGGPLPPPAAMPRAEAVGAEHVLSAEMHVATLASLAEQVDIRGIERALEKDGLTSPTPEAAGVEGTSPPLTRRNSGGGTESVFSDAVSDAGSGREGARRSLMKDGARRWKHLHVLERDVLLVLNAICKMAAREATAGGDSSYLVRGKLAALDLLVRVMDNPLHHWETVRQEFCSQLRQPLCLALLRNCTSPHAEVYTLTVRLLGIVLGRPSLRAALKAELGALFPLLVLRPIEAERPDPIQLLPALSAVDALAADPQLLVDLFVNYDCSLQAANLYERTCRGLARIAKGLDPALGLPPATATQAQRQAVAALQAVLQSLDTWATPLKEAVLAAATAADDVVVAGGVGSATPPPRGTPELPALNEAERFEAVKEKKHSLEAAVALFNRKPVKGVEQAVKAGLVADEAASIAAFLKQNAALLDKEMLGEYFGHHEQAQIDVMHAYIDLDRYAGLTIDNALRRLLAGFRLPGESQKIDRIMEKFAERYCKDNPAMFRNAGDAYILSFAIIMLNTDAHNPMAERRLANTDFILMNQTQVESGDFEPILPEAELQAIFDRITTNEIQLPDGGGPTNGGRARAAAVPGAPLIKLAASLGITQLLQPFRAGSVWDKQHGVDVERKWLLDQTRALMAQGGATGLLWHHASHSEHARPMLQVSYGYILRSVAAALRAAGEASVVGALMESLGRLVRLCGVLGLQAAMEEVVEALEEACGMGAPAAPGTLDESKQVSALATLLSIAGGPEGALLGAGWYRVLRVLSGLQAQQQGLLPQPAGGVLPASFDQPLAPYNARTLVGKARRSGLHAAGGMSRLMSMLTQRSDSDAALTTRGVGQEPDSPGNTEPADVALGPGHGMVVWSLQAVGEGLTDGVYLRSCGLDGDAVIAFFRALCAVSHKELTPSDPHETPRVYGVRQLVECMILNMGRIRLVLSRIWAIVAPHLVSAACAPDERVAKYAVEALQRLIDRLLLRAELANFTYQEEALRPFVSVLRHCDGPGVREFAVRCIAGAITAHPRGLGSGWRSLLQALTIAASDHNAAVVDQALDALQPVVEALYRGWQGHAFLPECVDAIMAAVANRQQEELSTSALFMLQSVARRLSAANAPNATALPEEDHGTHDTPFVKSKGPEAGDVVVVDQCEAWSMLMRTLVKVARLDHRARVADTAAQVAFDILMQYSAAWESTVFEAVVNECVLPVFDLPHRTFASFDGQPEPAPESEQRQRGDAMPLSGEGLPRVERQARRQLGQLWELAAAQYATRGVSMLHAAFALLVRYVMSNEQGMAFLGLLQLQAAVDRLGPVLDGAGWQAVVRTLSVASCTDHLLTALDPSEAMSAAEARAVEDVIRCRCALVVCCQRLVAEVVSDWQHTMPPEHQLQLLGVLKDSVDRAMAFNSDLQRRSTIAWFLEAHRGARGGAVQRESPALPRPPSRGTALVHELSVMEAEAMGHSLEAVLGTRRPPRHPEGPSSANALTSPPLSPLRTASPRPDTPGSVGSGSHKERPHDVSLVPDEVLQPAMLRQEIEGGLLLIQALLHLLKRYRARLSEATPTLAPIPEAVGAAAQSLLLEVCRSVVGTATADVLASEQGVGGGAPRWETALRSPLTVHALRGYLSLELDALHSHLPSAFKDLATLARSADITVRREVQALMQSRISPMVAAIADAGRWL